MFWKGSLRDNHGLTSTEALSGLHDTVGVLHTAAKRPAVKRIQRRTSGVGNVCKVHAACCCKQGNT